MTSDTLFLHDVVYETVVLREPALIQFNGDHDTSAFLRRVLMVGRQSSCIDTIAAFGHCNGIEHERAKIEAFGRLRDVDEQVLEHVRDVFARMECRRLSQFRNHALCLKGRERQLPDGGASRDGQRDRSPVRFANRNIDARRHPMAFADVLVVAAGSVHCQPRVLESLKCAGPELRCHDETVL